MTVDGLSDDAITMLLREVRSIAVVGASGNPSRPSHQVMQALIAHGYDVHPVNPGLVGTEVLERPCVARIADLQAPIDMLDVFRNPEVLPEIAGEAVEHHDRLGLRCLWMQQGIVNVPAAAIAAGAGIVVVMDRCTKIEISRLGVEPVAATR